MNMRTICQHKLAKIYDFEFLYSPVNVLLGALTPPSLK